MAAPTCSFVDSQKIVCDLIRPSGTFPVGEGLGARTGDTPLTSYDPR